MGQGNRHEDEPVDDPHDRPEDDLGDELDPPSSARRPLPDPLDRVWLHPTELSVLGSEFGAPAAGPKRSGHRPHLWIVPVIAGAAGALLTVVVLAIAGSFDSSSSPAGTGPQAADATTARVPTPAETLAKLSPSVVAVVAVDANGTRRGSGVCFRHGSEVLTSMRVVGDAATVRVITSDGTQGIARVAGRDRVTDLVLLDLQDDADVPAAPLAVARPTTGAPVWILGAARSGGSSPWMSHGMASSSDALVASDSGPTTAGLLEIDAPSNTAVVGGALVDASGSVTGIVLGHVNGSATTYAVTIGVAVDVAHQLDADGVAEHGAMDVRGVDTPTGPMIVQMPSTGPAAKAGVRVDDRVEAVNGRAVASVGELTAVVRSLEPGDPVVVELLRGKKPVEAHFRLSSTTG
jgi:putative serine protease PepD